MTAPIERSPNGRSIWGMPENEYGGRISNTFMSNNLKRPAVKMFYLKKKLNDFSKILL